MVEDSENPAVEVDDFNPDLGEDVAPAPVKAKKASKAQLAAQSSGDIRSYENKMMQMQRLLAAQPKVSVRIQKAIGPQSVIINGARFNIPAGIPVEVPEQVAELLRDAELI